LVILQASSSDTKSYYDNPKNEGNDRKSAKSDFRVAQISILLPANSCQFVLNTEMAHN